MMTSPLSSLSYSRPAGQEVARQAEAEMRSVLIVSDSIFESVGLAAILAEAGGFTVLEPATDANMARRMTIDHQPDTAVILKHNDVPSVLRALESSAPHEPSIVLVAEPGKSGLYADPPGPAGGPLVIPPDPDVLIPALRMASVGYLVYLRKASGADTDSGDWSLRTLAHRLTWREFQVFNLVARGWTNPEMARMLEMSERTVKGHVSRILAKLELPSRADLIVKSYATGLIAPTHS